MRLKIRVADAYATGRHHLLGDIGCQDRTFSKIIKRNKGFVALSDGAGSAKYSQLGAEYVVSEAFNIIKNKNLMELEPSLEFSREFIQSLHDGLQRKAQQESIEIKQLACTMLFLLLHIKKNRIFYFAGHIGDGLIIGNNQKKSYVLSHPEHGEFASSTYFVTSQDAYKHLRLYKGELSGNAGFLLTSDGTAECLYRKSDGLLAPACSQIFKWGENYKKHKIQSILTRNLKNIFTQETLDDCSLALISISGLSE